MVGSCSNGRPYALLKVDNLLHSQAGRLPRPELREDHQDLRNRRGLPRNRARRGGRMDRAQQRPPASGEGAMKSSWRIRFRAGARASLVLALGVALPGLVGRTRSSRSTARSRRRRSHPHRDERGPDRLAGRLHGAGAAAHRARPARRDERARQVDRRDQPGQPALGQHRPVGRAHAAGPQPQVAGRLPRADRRQVLLVSLENNAAGAAAASSSGRTTRFAESLNAAARRCATSTSGAAPTAPAASSSSCRTTRSASTSASRARAWSSSSCARACPTACAAASTSPTSARRCRASRRPSRAIACAWWSSRAAPGSTAPTRATTSSCSRSAAKVDPNKLVPEKTAAHTLRSPQPEPPSPELSLQPRPHP